MEGPKQIIPTGVPEPDQSSLEERAKIEKEIKELGAFEKSCKGEFMPGGKMDTLIIKLLNAEDFKKAAMVVGVLKELEKSGGPRCPDYYDSWIKSRELRLLGEKLEAGGAKYSCRVVRWLEGHREDTPEVTCKIELTENQLGMIKSGELVVSDDDLAGLERKREDAEVRMMTQPA